MIGRRFEDENHAPGGVTLDVALQSYLVNQGLSAATALGRVAQVWTDVVGKDVAEHAVPWRLGPDELLVAVDQPAWATEISFLSETILTGLENRLGYRVASVLKAHVRRSFDLE